MGWARKVISKSRKKPIGVKQRTMDTLTLNDILRAITEFRAETKNEFAKVREETKNEFAKVREETKNEFAKVREETKNEFAKVREETKNEFAKVREETKNEFAKVRNDDIKEINISISKLQTNVKRMDKTLNTKLENFNNSLNERITGATSSLGNVHERSFRQGLEDRFGKRYVRSFDANNLLGLARLVVNKKQYPYLNTDPIDQIDLAKRIATKITKLDVDILYNRIDRVLDFIVLNYDGISFKKILDRKQRVEDIIDKTSENTDYRSKLINEIKRILENENPEDYYRSSFGFAAFVCKYFREISNISDVKDDHGYQTNLELDCRGMVFDTSNSHVFDFAEIKSNDKTDTSNKAIEQVMRSASIIKRAIEAVHDDGLPVEVIARVFLNSSSNDTLISNLGKSDGINIMIERVKV